MKSTGQASSFAAAKTTLFTVAAKLVSTIGWTVFLTLAISLFTKLTKLNMQVTKLFVNLYVTIFLL